MINSWHDKKKSLMNSPCIHGSFWYPNKIASNPIFSQFHQDSLARLVVIEEAVYAYTSKQNCQIAECLTSWHLSQIPASLAIRTIYTRVSMSCVLTMMVMYVQARTVIKFLKGSKVLAVSSMQSISRKLFHGKGLGLLLFIAAWKMKGATNLRSWPEAICCETFTLRPFFVTFHSSLFTRAIWKFYRSLLGILVQ